MEAVDSRILNQKYQERFQIPSTSFEERCLQSTATYVEILKDLGSNPPIYVFITVVGAKGRWLASGEEQYDGLERFPIDREVLELPEAAVVDFPVNSAKVLRSSLDVVWNACGHKGSPNFADDGSWAPRRR
jgi:hypothetical protein